MPDLYDDLVGLRPIAPSTVLPSSLENRTIDAVQASRRRRFVAMAALGTAAALVVGVVLWQGVPRATSPLPPATGAGQPTLSSLSPTTTPSAEASSTPSSTASSPAPAVSAASAAVSGPPAVAATDIRRVVVGNFIMPSGRIGCDITADWINCDYYDYYASPPDPVWLPQDCRAMQWSVRVGLGGSTTTACHSDSIMESMTMMKDDGGYSYDVISWWKAGDPTVSYPRKPGQTDRVLAALPYGSALKNARFLCESATTGVTCRNLVTGHGFVMSREALKTF